MIAEEGNGGADLIISATGWVGHTAFIDPNTKKFKADNLEDFLKIKAGFVDGKILTAAEVKALAEIPSKEVLIGRLMGSLQSSLYGFAYAIQAIIDKVINDEFK